MNQSLMLDVKTIRIDGGTQSRTSINTEAVSEYATALMDGAIMPPVVAFFDGSNYWLGDGFHRLHAYRKAGQESIQVDVRLGTCRDARLYAAGANGAHGLRRTNDDKRRAVQMVLDDAQCAESWTDREIAKHCAVSVSFVGAMRRPEVATRQQVRREESAAKKMQKVESDSTNAHKAAVQHPEKSDGGCSRTTPLLTVGSFNGCTDAVDQAAKQASDRTKNIPAPDASTEPESPSDYSELDAAKDQINELQIEVTRLNDSLAIECYDVSEEAKTEASRIIEELRGEVRSLEAQLAAVTISRDTYMQENAQMKAQMKMQRREIEKLKSKD